MVVVVGSIPFLFFKWWVMFFFLIVNAVGRSVGWVLLTAISKGVPLFIFWARSKFRDSHSYIVAL